MKQRLPFDPDTAAAQRLLRGMREYAESGEPMDVVVTSAVLRVVAEDGMLRGETHQVGDCLTVPRTEGESLIARGNARPV